MALFRRSGEKHSLEIAMTGVKLGDRLLQIGCADAALVAALSAKAGMSGRASLLVATDEDAARAARAAERAGVLLEVARAPLDKFPYEDSSFDLIVINNQEGLIAAMKPEQRVAALQQARRVLAARGRIVIIERAPRAGLGALLSRTTVVADPHYQNSGGAVTALEAEGFKAVRPLAEREGLSFFEGIA
jgi:ubiquinone/menaquinone biosynthesis C-methylase UbiE